VTRSSAGFSLIELMVAVTLGLLLTVALISVFVGSRSAYQSTTGVASLADEGRFVLDTISQQARGAGFMGCTAASDSNTNGTTTYSVIDAVLNEGASSLAYDFQFGVGGYEATGTGAAGAFTIPATPTAGALASGWTPNLDPAFTAATNEQVQGSDVLVLRSSLPQSTPVYTTAAAAQGAGSLTVSSAGNLQPGQLAVVSDCSHAVPFQISSVTAGTPATINFGGSTGPPGNASAALPQEFSAGALVYPLTTTVFYIGVGADGDSALRRLDLQNGMVGAAIFTDSEVVEDVENMQILYGLDTPSGTSYVTADQVPDFTEVVSLEIAVLVASPPGSTTAPATARTFNLLGTTVTAPKDTRLRRVFEKTIGLRNDLHWTLVMNRRSSPHGRGGSRGAVLVVALILLLVLTLIGVTAARMQTAQEGMARNDDNHQLAFQAAEAALRDGEALISQYSPGAFLADNNGLYNLSQELQAATPASVADTINWNSPGTQSMSYSGAPLNGVPQSPQTAQIIIESLPPAAVSGQQLNSNGYSGSSSTQYAAYRVTVHAEGADSSSSVTLQGIISSMPAQ
jgi:type IV pilus assembly protein PilW